MKRTLIFCLITILCTTAFSGTSAVAGRRLPEVSSEARVAHARELLGKRYEASPVKQAEGVPALEAFVYHAVQASLPKAYAGQSLVVSRTILEESARYRMDPIFLIALMLHESRFNPIAIGSHGEIGLMQIRPTTARWIAAKANFRWTGSESLKDMPTNIRIGSAYLAMLRKSFSAKSNYYLAAYNIGAAGVKRRIGRSTVPNQYPRHVMEHYIDLYRELGESTAHQLPPAKANDSILAFFL